MPLIYTGDEPGTLGGMNREPALIIGALGAFLEAVVAGLAYSQDWSGESTALIMGVVGSFLFLVGAVLTRESVYSPESYDAR